MELRFTLDGNVIENPKGWETIKIVIERDEVIDGLFLTTTSDLTFHSDGYDYLKAKIDADDFCDLLPITIENYDINTRVWDLIFTGTIDLTKGSWNISRCEYKTMLTETSAMTLVSKGKGVRVFFDIVNNELGVAQHVYSTGAHSFGAGTQAYLVYDALQLILTEISGGAITLVSDIFTTGTYENFCLSQGWYMAGLPLVPGGTVIDLTISFEELFSELNKIFNLSFQIYTDNLGNDFMRIEPKSYFENLAPTLALINIPEIKMEVSLKRTFRTILLGFDKLWNSLYDKGTQYGNDSTCSSAQLNLLNTYVVDSDLINAILLDTNDSRSKYGNFVFFIECEPYPGVCTFLNCLQSIATLVGADYKYNQTIKPEDNMARWAETLNGVSFTSENGAVVVTKSNASKYRNYKFTIPIAYTDFKLLNSPADALTISGRGLTTPTDADILKVSYMLRTGMAEVEVFA